MHGDAIDGKRGEGGKGRIVCSKSGVAKSVATLRIARLVVSRCAKTLHNMSVPRITVMLGAR